MARTVGAKDKKPRKKYVRKVNLTQAQVEMANHLDIPVETYAKELVKVKTRKPRLPKVDWEKLAKDLQRALAMEIKENDELKTKIHGLEVLNVQYSGIIAYLESKRGHNSI